VTANTTPDTVHRPEQPDCPVLFQGQCGHAWDGEETVDMLERRAARNLTVRELIEWT